VLHFGPGFEEAPFVAAFNSAVPAELNRARLVSSNFQAVTDGMVELIRLAATFTGLQPQGRGLTVNPDINQVRADGGISGPDAGRLITLKQLSNGLRHAYIDVDPSDVHAGVGQALTLLPSFTKSFVAWLATYSITFPR
jgi:hypothetical protein